jgi:hypothetical protein
VRSLTRHIKTAAAALALVAITTADIDHLLQLLGR